jgi:hypothetical protein
MTKTDKLLQTDQTSCFDEAGNELDCLDSGQDGAYGFMKRSSEDRFRA